MFLQSAAAKLHALEMDAPTLNKRALAPAEINNLTTQAMESNSPSQQNDFFSHASLLAEAIVEKLNAINPDNLSPKQSHDLLYELKSLLNKE